MGNIIIKTGDEIERMRDAGRCAAEVLDLVKTHVAPGISTWELDQVAKQAMDKLGAKSAAFGYGGPENPFPSHICISLNDQVVHGIGKKDVVLKEGDIVSLDVALSYKGFVGDNTVTVGIGVLEKPVENLLKITEEALYK